MHPAMMFSPLNNWLDVKDNYCHQISRFFCCNESKESARDQESILS